MSEVRIELLVGRKVHDVNGESAGRIEEIRGKKSGNGFIVEAYLVGASALVDRLGAWSLVRPIRGLLGKSLYSMHRVPWEEMDLSDATRPRLTVAKSELRRVPI